MITATTPPPTTSNKILLDVRGLAPPEPMQRVLQTLAGLPPRAVLTVNIHREPIFLYEIIDADDWRRSSRQLASNHWEINIWRAEES